MSKEHPGISPLNHLSDGEPVDKIGSGDKLKTNYKDMAKRYELAERAVWAKCSKFKRQVIIDCRINGTDDGMFTDYANDIRKLAENEDNKLDDNLPEVPRARKPVEIPDPAVI
jgi:hypothetical protein